MSGLLSLAVAFELPVPWDCQWI
uniref:Uncharacterized protein n=1 Tax=Anguilla anguilla TaxID=7936 RepID=A0A0E9VBU1_ANGAN